MTWGITQVRRFIQGELGSYLLLSHTLIFLIPGHVCTWQTIALAQGKVLKAEKILNWELRSCSQPAHNQSTYSCFIIIYMCSEEGMEHSRAIPQARAQKILLRPIYIKLLSFKLLTVCLHLCYRDKGLSASGNLTRSLCSPWSSHKF